MVLCENEIKFWHPLLNPFLSFNPSIRSKNKKSVPRSRHWPRRSNFWHSQTFRGPRISCREDSTRSCRVRILYILDGDGEEMLRDRHDSPPQEDHQTRLHWHLVTVLRVFERTVSRALIGQLSQNQRSYWLLLPEPNHLYWVPTKSAILRISFQIDFWDTLYIIIVHLFILCSVDFCFIPVLFCYVSQN